MDWYNNVCYGRSNCMYLWYELRRRIAFSPYESIGRSLNRRLRVYHLLVIFTNTWFKLCYILKEQNGLKITTWFLHTGFLGKRQMNELVWETKRSCSFMWYHVWVSSWTIGSCALKLNIAEVYVTETCTSQIVQKDAEIVWKMNDVSSRFHWINFFKLGAV